MHHYRTSTIDDCREMAPYMRLQDVVEVGYSSGAEPLEALEHSFKASQECFTIVHDDGDVVGMFGVADNGIFASPWLLGTDKLVDTKRVMLPVAAKWVKEINVQYPLLLNYVHKENTVSKRWLKSLGFEFIKLDEKYGIGEQPFYQFVRINKNV
tara:strand:- start:723 stop:1184 length:462 start_codon:yes stop_codon:yes gene_type:complete